MWAPSPHRIPRSGRSPAARKRSDVCTSYCSKRRRSVAIRSVAVPWLGGGLMILGYAAFNWLRAKKSSRTRTLAVPRARPSASPLAASLPRVPDELALDLEAEPPPANINATTQRAELGALFLGRA